MRRWPKAALLSLAALLVPSPVLAYRPFDGTDAAVAEPGQVEAELGPVEYLRQGSERSLIAPAATINYAFAPRWEAVLESAAVHGLSAGSRRSSLVGNGAFLKTVLREGSLQDQPGPSLATEFGLLLPGVNSEPGTGGRIAGILSQQWRSLTVHLNAAASITREQHGDLFLDLIVEGPHDWPVRPVAEVFREREFGGTGTNSALVGAIWQLSETLSFDAALRGARSGGHSQGELRAGLTVAFPLP